MFVSFPLGKAHKSITITLISWMEELAVWGGGYAPVSLRGLVGGREKLVRLVLSLGFEGDLQCLCLKCFSSVLVNRAERLL